MIHACAYSNLAFRRLYTTHELWTEVCGIVQGTGSKTIPKKKKSKKAKRLSEKALQKAVKEEKPKAKEKMKYLSI